jgi:hypothetical protein
MVRWRLALKHAFGLSVPVLVGGLVLVVALRFLEVSLRQDIAPERAAKGVASILFLNQSPVRIQDNPPIYMYWLSTPADIVKVPKQIMGREGFKLSDQKGSGLYFQKRDQKARGLVQQFSQLFGIFVVQPWGSDAAAS